MMDSVQHLTGTITALESCQIDYMLVGAFSSNVYGVPRSTRDIDFVIDPGDAMLADLLAELGDDYRLDRQMRVEGFTGSLRNDVTHVPTGFRIELFRLTDDSHQQERFARRLRMLVPGTDMEAWVPTAEDVIVQKLRWARPKDCDDIREVLAVQAGHLDMDYIVHWTQQHGTLELLHELMDSHGPEPT